MKGTFELQDVDKVEATLTVTMTLEKWRELVEVIDDKWPGWEFRSLIRDMVTHAESKFYGEQKVEN